MTTESWKPIQGFEGIYEVSDLGRVRSLSRVFARKNGIYFSKIGKVLAQGKKRNGYMVVALRDRMTIQTFHVHRLVAIAFLSNPEGKTDVNHKNCVRGDNVLSNLEWMTRSENLTHGYAFRRSLSNA